MHVLIASGSRAERLLGAAARERDHPGRARLVLSAPELPFLRPEKITLPSSPRLIRIDDLELAFPNRQSGGIRLVLTHPLYLLQKWVDRLGPDDLIVATADREALHGCAPEAFQSRGPWRRFEAAIAQDAKGTTTDTKATGGTAADADGAAAAPDDSGSAVAMSLRLASAFASSSPSERLLLCRDAARLEPASEVAALALASVCREEQDVDGARAALDEALRLAPDWEAAHFEDGKFWLAADDMPRARDAFARAAGLMPSFSAAFSNLGATLGELDDPDGASAAFMHALDHDPDNFMLLNNIGVVNRELGRLEASEQALARVTAIAPDFVFGHYNLGHTRFLRGDYAGAVNAYEEGRRRDPQKNRRQGCRLALARFATGDRAAAEPQFWDLVDGAAPEEREDLLLEAYEIGRALLQAEPGLKRHQGFVDRIGAALAL